MEKKSDSPDEDKSLADSKALLPMKREGSKSHLKSKIPTMKFVCPKMKWEYNKADKTKRRVCHCDNPCTTSSCGRMIYIYPEKNLRAYPGVERGSAEWEETYKIRVNVEKSINHFKDSFCVANRKTQNEKKLHLFSYNHAFCLGTNSILRAIPIPSANLLSKLTEGFLVPFSSLLISA